MPMNTTIAPCSLPKKKINGDVLPGVTSAPQQQKFYTDDMNSVWNLVRNPDWLV